MKFFCKVAVHAQDTYILLVILTFFQGLIETPKILGI